MIKKGLIVALSTSGILNDLLARVTSRKFLLALAAFIVAIANHDYHMAELVILAYLGVQGAADTVSAYKGNQ